MQKSNSQWGKTKKSGNFTLTNYQTCENLGHFFVQIKPTVNSHINLKLKLIKLHLILIFRYPV